MKKEGTIGVAAFVAIAAVLGYGLQSGPKQDTKGASDRSGISAHTKSGPAKSEKKETPGCISLHDVLQDFLDIQDIPFPVSCYEKEDAPTAQPRQVARDKVPQLKFVIALLPDPVHTHLPVLFDQFATAVQEGAQDEKYDFDGSWLPWDDDDRHYPLLADEKIVNYEKERKEDQPGIILFRKTLPCDKTSGKVPCEPVSKGYFEGLAVFVVGEDATHGIHRDQFRNAVAWLRALEPKTADDCARVAILGPTFSGSLPSLGLLLSETGTAAQLDFGGSSGRCRLLEQDAGTTSHPNGNANGAKAGQPAQALAEKTEPGGESTLALKHLAVYSGSVSGDSSVAAFTNRFGYQVKFHSFVHSDAEVLNAFSKFMQNAQPTFDWRKLAIISEDETAYGRTGGGLELSNKDKSPVKILELYYPRDISAVRGAYQTKSLFNGDVNSQSSDAQRTSLPTDLADPSGKVHDSIVSFGGNQTPLAQEAFLLRIVAALREFDAQYIILRSSNTLDQLFLTNFLRRTYPDGRIVILSSDLMFVRERGATGLSGAMTLSTYPLFPLVRDWTEHPLLPASDRIFGTDTAEGTYIALRLLLNDSSMNGYKVDANRCHVFVDALGEDHSGSFVPPVSCTDDPPIPDYRSPDWMLAESASEFRDVEHCLYQGPPTWLSVIGANKFWPIASLRSDQKSELPNAAELNCGKPTTPAKGEERKNGDTQSDSVSSKELGETPEIPVGMKLFLLALSAFAIFHAWCCWSGSYTGKPSFRAYFASYGDGRHVTLVFGGSCCILFLAIVAGWGSGVFAPIDQRTIKSGFAIACMSFICLTAWLAVFTNSVRCVELSRDRWGSERLKVALKDRAPMIARASALIALATLIFVLCFVVPLEWVLRDETRVLTYWRAMHLASGVSAIVPIFSVFIGLYLAIWFNLHGLALFGPDRPCLPPQQSLAIKVEGGSTKGLLKMFSKEEAADRIEDVARPLNAHTGLVAIGLFVLFFVGAWGIAGGVPLRSLSAKRYAVIFVVWLDVCCSLVIAEAWAMYRIWEELRRLLTFLDRLPLRRTFAALHGFSWGGVWKMSGNVLEVRYKVISRQMECMNHTITSLEKADGHSSDPGVGNSLVALQRMHDAGIRFAEWYSENYRNPVAGDLSRFEIFQKSTAVAAGTLLINLLLPAWKADKKSLILELAKKPKADGKEEDSSSLALAEEEHIRNAEEFVCLAYLGFVQNILGRLRTVAMTILVLLLASTFAVSSYPFDPRQPLSAVLVAVFVAAAVVIVKVYAEMHRDATLSHVTNTNPGELGTEFWFKIIGFGIAPVIGLVTRIFPGITDFVFSWLQPGISALK
jgi:hypothetical protein